jgi:hypothetical protein
MEDLNERTTNTVGVLMFFPALIFLFVVAVNDLGIKEGKDEEENEEKISS